MSTKQTILSNTASQIFSKIITSLIGLATRKLLTTYLGPAGFGDYVFLLTYATLFGSIADWGTITISVREASQHPQKQPQIFGQAIFGRLVLSIIACVVALALSPLIIKSQFSVSLVSVTCFLIIAMALKASFGIIFETLLQMNRWIYVDITASLTTLSLFALAVILKLPLFYFLAFLLFATILSCLVGLFLARKITPIDFHVYPTLLKHLAIESFPMGLALIMFSVYNRIDTIILRTFRNASEVGFYGVSYFIYENIVIVAAFILNSVYPLLSRISNSSRFTVLYHQYYSSMLLLGTLAFIATYLLAPFLVIILSSQEFAPSIPILKTLSIALFFSYLNHTTGYSLIALGKQKLYSLITLSALFFNVFFNLLFIPYYGAIAAAWITVATEALVQILSFILIQRYIQSPRGH